MLCHPAACQLGQLETGRPKVLHESSEHNSLESLTVSSLLLADCVCNWKLKTSSSKGFIIVWLFFLSLSLHLSVCFSGAKRLKATDKNQCGSSTSSSKSRYEKRSRRVGTAFEAVMRGVERKMETSDVLRQ